MNNRHKALLAVMITAAFLFVAFVLPSRACAQGGCGLKPLPPFGCSSNDAVCRCDGSGCEWVWYCR